MSKNPGKIDIGSASDLRRYAGESWKVRQEELLAPLPILIKCQEQIGKSEQTLRRWVEGKYPIPLEAGFQVAHATGDWRLPQSYALECNKTFAPIGARQGTDVEQEIMNVSGTFAKYIELFLRIKNKQAGDLEEALLQLQVYEAQLHEDIRASMTALIASTVSQQNGGK
jgi:hypothetical protein